MNTCQESAPKLSHQMRRFAVLVAWWSVIALLGLYAFACFKSGGQIANTTRDFVTYRSLALSYPALGGIMLGAIHYLVAGLCRKKSRHQISLKVCCGILLVMSCLAAYPVFVVKSHLRYGHKLFRQFHQMELTKELFSLMETDNPRRVIERMERAFKDYEDAKRELGPERVKSMTRVYGGRNGVGYFYCTLGESWEGLIQNIPFGLAMFLEAGPLHNYHVYPQRRVQEPEKWEPLGQEMISSRTPMLKVLGYWLLDNREACKSEVQSLHNSGDRSCDALYEFFEARN